MQLAMMPAIQSAVDSPKKIPLILRLYVFFDVSLNKILT